MVRLRRDRHARLATPYRSPVAPNDAMWLQDSPTNLMVINAVYTTDHVPIDVVREVFLRQVVNAEGGRRYPRFRYRVVRARRRWYWQEDEQFDIADHIVPGPGGLHDTDALQEYVGSIASQALPPDRPLWQFQHIEEFEDGGSALVLRMHHCMADGIALVPILFALMDERDRLEASGRLPPPTLGNRLTAFKRLVTAPLIGPLILAERLAWRADHHAIHGRPLSGDKRIAWTAPLDLAVVKQVRDQLGATVNDVLMTTVSGGLARYFARTAPPPARIHVTMPVNIRRPGETLRMENRFAPVLLDLPIGVGSALERLETIKARMSALKRSVEPLVLYGIQNVLLTALGPRASRPFIDFLANKCTAVVTNLPGPSGEVSLAGRRLRSLMFWVPQRAEIGVGVSIMTVGSTVRIGVIADRELVADPKQVTEEFEAEFEAIRRERGL